MARAATILEETFADPRLVNLDARLVVEGRVAALLASGWRPGHESLLDAAVRAFDWERDHARLAPFGPAGAAIAAALRERVALERLAPHQRRSLRALLVELRRRDVQGAALPAVDMRTLRGEIAFLQLLTERCPTWTRLVAPARAVQARVEQWNALPPDVRSAAAASTPGGPGAAWPGPPRASRSDRSLLRVLLGGAVALSLLGKMIAFTATPRPAPAWQPMQRPHARPAAEAPADDADLARRQRDAEALLREALAASAPAR
jgi:protein TonB